MLDLYTFNLPPKLFFSFLLDKDQSGPQQISAQQFVGITNQTSAKITKKQVSVDLATAVNLCMTAVTINMAGS